MAKPYSPRSSHPPLSLSSLRLPTQKTCERSTFSDLFTRCFFELSLYLQGYSRKVRRIKQKTMFEYVVDLCFLKQKTELQDKKYQEQNFVDLSFLVFTFLCRFEKNINSKLQNANHNIEKGEEHRRHNIFFF